METLLQETLRLLKSTDIPIKQICQEAAVGESWIRRLMRGDYPDPGVNKIERLNVFLRRNRSNAA